MKTIENHYGNDWRDRILNAWPMCLHIDAIATILVLAWDAEGIYRPEARSLFYNGYVFIRITFPAGIWIHVKPTKNMRIQLGAGWKLNGRFGLTCRAQTDEAAARGEHGPNLDQASGWERGTA